MNRSHFHNKGTPTSILKNIFEHLENPIETLSEAHSFAQKNLLRKGERWDSQEDNRLHNLIQRKNDLLFHDIKRLGILDPVQPNRQSYDFILIAGELKDTVQEKLDYVAELKQTGLTFAAIVLLGGERPLRDDEKNDLPSNITAESEMMKHLYQNHSIIKDEKMILVNAPLIQNNSGLLNRPTTESTLLHFTQIAPHAGSCLMISNTPYIIRQTYVALRTLDQNSFPTEGIGKKMNEDEHDIFLLLDEFARILYEINKGMSYENKNDL